MSNEPVKKPDPQWVKQTLIEDEAKWRREVGLEVNVTDMDRDYRESLERVDAREKYGPKRKPQARNTGAAKKAADRLGYRYEQGVDTFMQQQAMLRWALKTRSEHAAKLDSRIATLVQCNSDGSFVFEKFAQEVITEWAAHKSGSGVYFQRKKHDAALIFRRRMEDIADRSTLELIGLGGWR